MEIDEELSIVYKRTHSAFTIDPAKKNELYFQIKDIIKSCNTDTAAEQITLLFEKFLKDKEADIVDKISNQQQGTLISGEKKGFFRRIG